MAPASGFAQPCGLVVALVALSRVVRTMATSPMPLCYVTTLSNTVTLCAALSVALGCGEANPALRTSGAGLAVAMMAAFWYLYRVHGLRAVYGDYEPSAYEVLTDHLVLPAAAVSLAVGAFRTATCRATLTHLGVLCVTWLVYTHVVRGAHAPPSTRPSAHAVAASTAGASSSTAARSVPWPLPPSAWGTPSRKMWKTKPPEGGDETPPRTVAFFRC